MPYDIVYDKDGILAMTVLLRLARRLHSQGKNLSSELDRLYDRYGYFSSANSYFIVQDSTKLKEAMARLREPRYKTELNGRKVVRVRDLTIGHDSSTADQKPTLPVSSESEMITFWFEPGSGDEFTTAIMTIRGSGTEPKLKFYIEAQATTMQAAEKASMSIEADLKTSWLVGLDLRAASDMSSALN